MTTFTSSDREAVERSEKIKKAIEDCGKWQWKEQYEDPTDEDLALMLSLIYFVLERVKE